MQGWERDLKTSVNKLWFAGCYLREREFHWNRRKASDSERTADAIRGAKGKRLMYASPTGA